MGTTAVINRHIRLRYHGWKVAAASLLTALAIVLVHASAQSVPRPVPAYGYQVIRVYPHDPNAFTQGLIYLEGYLYESTGLHGRSSVRKVELETGRVLQQSTLPFKYFGEGLAHWGADLLQLTWTTQTGFVYDRLTFNLKRSFQYRGEGWGLTHDGTQLIMSDGTATLRFLDPHSFQETGHVTVHDRGAPIPHVNELEYVRGVLYANVWQTDWVARIAPRTGQVIGWVDLRGLLSPTESAAADVLNGIAYDAERERLFVTGKVWPKVFEIKIVP